MRRKIFTYLSNAAFAAAIVLSIYIAVDTYLVRRSLPPGVCPIDNKRILIYTAIGLALVSFLLSLFEKKK